MTVSKLSDSPVVRTLARDLGIHKIDNPVSDILKFCEKRVQGFLKEFPACDTLSSFLTVVAAKLGTEFYEIHNDAELVDLQSRFVINGEKIFSNLANELDSEVFGITFKRTNREPWEPIYISVIDCRGDKGYRTYFTKWHELAHLLVITDQMRLKFRRTYHSSSANDPEEAMIDIIAGKFGFYSHFIRKKTGGQNDISFDKIEALCAELCPESSYQASLIGFVQAWPGKCILLYCELGYKTNELQSIAQGRLFNTNHPKPYLRATKVTLSKFAQESSFRIHKNMRVPKNSIISHVHENIIDYAEAGENLSLWESSDGKKLQDIPIVTMAKRHHGAIYALITTSQQ